MPGFVSEPSTPRGEVQALAALLGKEAPDLSPSVIARLRSDWQAEHERWQGRDLSARRYVYVWADGVYLRARMEPQAECMLVVIGATPEGDKGLVGFQVGTRESAQSWRELPVGLKARGLAIAPEPAVGDLSRLLERVERWKPRLYCTDDWAALRRADPARPPIRRQGGDARHRAGPLPAATLAGAVPPPHLRGVPGLAHGGRLD